jgi:hypothetical protein
MDRFHKSAIFRRLLKIEKAWTDTAQAFLVDE